jgi:hypothetical protein
LIHFSTEQFLGDRSRLEEVPFRNLPRATSVVVAVVAAAAVAIRVLHVHIRMYSLTAALSCTTKHQMSGLYAHLQQWWLPAKIQQFSLLKIYPLINLNQTRSRATTKMNLYVCTAAMPLPKICGTVKGSRGTGIRRLRPLNSLIICPCIPHSGPLTYQQKSIRMNKNTNSKEGEMGCCGFVQ